MTKKIFTLLLALAMALSLVACNSHPPVSDDTTNDDSYIQQEIVDTENNIIPDDNTDPVTDADTDVKGDDSTVGDTEAPASDNVTDEDKPQAETTPTQPNSDNSGMSTTTKPDTSDNNSTENVGSSEDKKPTEAPEKETHQHSYTTKVVEPTCKASGYTLHTCTCGDSYKDTTTKKLSHSYSDKVVAPTATAQGYTLHTCGRCGDSYKDNYIPASGTSNSGSSSITTPSVPVTPSTPSQPDTPSTPVTPPTPAVPSKPVHKHDYTTSVTSATCTTQGYTTYTCSCGDSYTDDYTGGNGHQWSEVYEEVPVFETVCFTRCGHCHADITGNVSAHVKEEALAGNGSRSYQSYEQVQVGTATELVGYACSVCGTEK